MINEHRVCLINQAVLSSREQDTCQTVQMIVLFLMEQGEHRSSLLQACDLPYFDKRPLSRPFGLYRLEPTSPTQVTSTHQPAGVFSTTQRCTYIHRQMRSGPHSLSVCATVPICLDQRFITHSSSRWLSRRCSPLAVQKEAKAALSDQMEVKRGPFITITLWLQGFK